MGLSAHGEFLGVAGCDLSVSMLARKLPVDLPGFRRAYLVSEDGKIAVNDTLEAEVLKHATDANEELNLPEVDDRALAAKIFGSERGGYMASGDRLFVFSKLISPPWTYVAELEKARYIEH
jgi:hypothetical protein